MSLTLESVFVTDAFPQHTYVSVEQGRIERELDEGLAMQNKIVSLVGPSKCGKSTLCDKKFGPVGKLLVTGDSCDSTDRFWQLLFHQLPEADFHDGDAPHREMIITKVAEHKLPVVIDDFHYVDSDVQKRLCQQMKNAATQGIRFIVLNTPQRGDDPIRSNQDLAGRFFCVNVNFWRKEVLREIGVKGFQILQIEVSPEILDKLALECLGSPQLMQTLCLELGREYLIPDMPFPEQRILIENFDWSAVRQRAVRSYDHAALYERLKNGPPRRGQARNVYKLENGTSGDVYDVIMYVLASDPPFLSIDIDRIRERAQVILAKGNQPNFSAALDQIKDLFKTGHRPVDYDEEKRTINILDPHFYFYLRTKIAES